MNETLTYYNENADAFIAGTQNADLSAQYQFFLGHLAPGGKLLDLGCGSGRDSAYFASLGFAVTAVDGSEALCKRVKAHYGIDAQCIRFEALDFAEEFDAIWACASLLHVAKSEIDFVMEKMKRALKDRGIMYVSFKYGENEREKDGRFFSDYTEESLIQLLERHGFTIEEIFVSCDVRKEREGERWVNAMVRKIA